MRKIILIGVLLLVLPSLLIGCQAQKTEEQPEEKPSTSEPAPSEPSDEAPKKEASVNISNFTFNPKSVTIEKGGTITWTNNDSAAHTATGDDGEFDSGELDQGKKYTKTFDKTGTFKYHCEIHPSMTATVEVK